MTTKAALIDRLSVRAVIGIAVAFVACLFLIALGGVNGPEAVTWSEFPMTLACLPAGCNATGTATLDTLTPWNQATWVILRMERPLKVDGTPALLMSNIEFDLKWLGTVETDSSTPTEVAHVTRMFCRQRETRCSSMLVLSQPWIQSKKYAVKVTLQDPLATFARDVADLKPEVSVTFRQGYIQYTYTTFELGWKVTFIVLTVFIWLYFVIRLCSGPGNKDEATGQTLKSSPQQIMIAMLGALLVMFNDPFYLAYITAPSIGTAGAQSFFTASFIALLLFWFLTAFDLARMQGENGMEWDPTTADPSTRPGVCFWLPKTMLIAILWTVSLAAYVYVRYQQLSDPAFSIAEATGSFFGWIQTFVGGLGGLYILYSFIILVLGFRRFKTMTPSNKFILAVTVTSLLLIMIGLFSSAFVGARVGSALLLVTYGCANLYVWTLMFIYLPAARPSGWSAVPGAGSGDASAGMSGGPGGHTQLHEEAAASADANSDGASADFSIEMPSDLEVSVVGNDKKKVQEKEQDQEAETNGPGPQQHMDRAARVRRMSGKLEEGEA